MAEFIRSRLDRNNDEQITRKTVFLGLLTFVLFGAVVIFGLPFLIKFSVFLGETKNRQGDKNTEVVLPPLPPRLILPFEATNSSQILIGGIAEAGVTIELLKNDVSIDKVNVSSDGTFNFNGVSLDKDDNRFQAVAITDKGGSSELSKTLLVVYDDTDPLLQMINPSEDKLTVDYADFDVVGKSEKGVSVLINGRVAMVDDEGKFKIRVQLSAGKNGIEIIVRDLAGNEVKKTIEITYDI